MALKRFLVFAFDPADAAGGWRDFRGDADTKEEAERLAEKHHGRIQIVDTGFEEKVGGAPVHLVYTLYREFEYQEHSGHGFGRIAARRPWTWSLYPYRFFSDAWRSSPARSPLMRTIPEFSNCCPVQSYCA